MTYDDDYISLCFDGGTKRYPLKMLGLEWPPPEHIKVLGFTMVQTRRSQITDEERLEMAHICRGAEYFPDARGG